MTTQPDPQAQAELDLGIVPTGHPKVDAALEPLASLAGLPVAAHPDAYDRVQANLHQALTELDEE